MSIPSTLLARLSGIVEKQPGHSFPYRRGLGGAPVQWASNGDANGGGDIERLTRDYSRHLDDVIDSHGGQQNAEGAKRFMKPLDKWLAEKTGA